MKFELIVSAVVGGSIAYPSPAAAQEVAPVTLQLIGPEFKTPFTYVTGVRELVNGALIVIDAGEQRAWLVNLAAGKQSPVANTGSGALEYTRPGAVSAVGAETAIHDFELKRILFLDANGRPVRTRPVPPLPGSGFGPDNSFHVDAAGDIYRYSSPVIRTARGLEPATARAILRIHGDPPRTDTVATVPLPKGDVQVQSGSGGGTSMQWGVANPYAPRDAWTATEDGRIAIVHAMPYRVEWITPAGVHVLGPEVPYQALPVTAADKAAYAAKQGSGGVRVSGADAQDSKEDGGRSDWPAVKPPFGGDPVMADRNGQVWVLRNGGAGDPRNHYDVFGARGRLAERVDLPAGYKIVGFGRDRVYAVRVDANGGQYLAALH